MMEMVTFEVAKEYSDTKINTEIGKIHKILEAKNYEPEDVKAIVVSLLAYGSASHEKALQKRVAEN